MDNISDLYHFPVTQWGGVAARLYSKENEGQVSALFKSSFYVKSGDGFICIGNQNLRPSPLNVITSAPCSMDWSASGLKLNDPARFSNGILRIGNRLTFSFAGADQWQPDPLPANWHAGQLQRGLATIRLATQQRNLHEGLAAVINLKNNYRPKNSICKAAAKPIDGVQAWLLKGFSNSERPTMLNPEIIKPLIGLGPGLTPSGDDFMAGVMIALHALDYSHVCDPFWHSVQSSVEPLTNPISFAHLQCAADGQASSAIHQTLSALFSGRSEDIHNSLPGIDDIGHTSGWDCMAGVVITLETYLQTQNITLLHLQDHGN